MVFFHCGRAGSESLCRIHKKEWANSSPSSGVIVQLILFFYTFILHMFVECPLYSKVLVINAHDIVYLELAVNYKLYILFFVQFGENPLEYFKMNQSTDIHNMITQ